MKIGTQVTFMDADYAAEVYGPEYGVAVMEVVDASLYSLTVAPVVSDGQSVFPNLVEAITVTKYEVRQVAI